MITFQNYFSPFGYTSLYYIAFFLYIIAYDCRNLFPLIIAYKKKRLVNSCQTLHFGFLTNEETHDLFREVKQKRNCQSCLLIFYTISSKIIFVFVVSNPTALATAKISAICNMMDAGVSMRTKKR